MQLYVNNNVDVYLGIIYTEQLLSIDVLAGRAKISIPNVKTLVNC